MNSLKGKVAVVVGASSGIGRASAIAFARAGARVVVSARRREDLESLAKEIDGVAVVGDVRDDSVARACVSAAERLGGLDIAMNNVGLVGEMKPLVETSRETWDDVIATNLTASFVAMQHQVPAMRARGGGSLIFTSSFVGTTVAMPGMGAYAAAKAGLGGLVKTLAAELGAERIRVNALLPGGTDTALAPQDEGARAWVRGIHALKRMASADEIAAAALFLASDASSFVTGTSLLVDGGVSITK